jgi:fructosamine-3-kinase
MGLWESIGEQIGAATGIPFQIGRQSSVGGGCINATHRVSDGARHYFVKLNSAERLAMFEAEADGLCELARAGAIRVPEPVTSGTAAGQAYLVMEALELGGHGSMAGFAERFAALHRVTAEHFGWYRDNTIGATLQPNTREADWAVFWSKHRLGYQLELVRRQGGGRRLLEQGEALQERLGELFSDYRPQPSLLHGDLWSGNYSFTRSGEPVIFDPAVYYGDREADLAMTELFGGFGRDFYAAYEAAWPLDPGYRVRKTLYNLYHILNHFNLFGGGYADQAEAMIDRLLAELRG